MKRIIVTILILSLTFMFSGCKEKDEEVPPETEIVSSETNASDIVEEEIVSNTDSNEDVIEKETTAKVSGGKKSDGDPPTGEDHTITGVPEPIDTKTSDDGDILVLVNKLHAVSSDYKPKDMVYMDNSLSTWENLELKEEAYEAYKKMYADSKELGYNLKVCSAYRTYKTQISLFNNSIANRGWETTYLRSAYPGRSEHHTGLCIDITSKSMGWNLSQDFADYEDGKWLNTHCQDYGFIVRYPKGKTDITGYAYEPWHFRYVGVEAAKYIMENNLTLEEYLGE